MKMRQLVAVTCLLPFMALGCGGDKAPEQAKKVAQQSAAPSNFDPCALLTFDEIQAAAGWKPDSSQKKAYGSTGNCTYYGPDMMKNVAILVGQGMPDMSSSQKMAEWRAKQYADYKVTNATVEPIEGMGVPAIRNEFGVVGIEMAIGNQLVTVSGLTLKFDEAKKLASIVLGRMKS